MRNYDIEIRKTAIVFWIILTTNVIESWFILIFKLIIWRAHHFYFVILRNNKQWASSTTKYLISGILNLEQNNNTVYYKREYEIHSARRSNGKSNPIQNCQWRWKIEINPIQNCQWTYEDEKLKSINCTMLKCQNSKCICIIGF